MCVCVCVSCFTTFGAIWFAVSGGGGLTKETVKTRICTKTKNSTFLNSIKVRSRRLTCTSFQVTVVAHNSRILNSYRENDPTNTGITTT
jgi:hypothetical protein